MGPAIELGRSFIRPEFQKQYAPLLLLWKGILRYAASRPECGALFGAVSISSRYNPVSRHLIVKFLEAHRLEHVAPLVAPRHPYRPRHGTLRRTAPVDRAAATIEDVSARISEIEPDGKGIPVLVKQYFRAGGKLLGFNVDRAFSSVLDALLMVDLRAVPRHMLERYR
jgi:putative hemolysin